MIFTLNLPQLTEVYLLGFSTATTLMIGISILKK